MELALVKPLHRRNHRSNKESYFGLFEDKVRTRGKSNFFGLRNSRKTRLNPTPPSGLVYAGLTA